MRANQKLVALDGYEVMLFPLEYMNISQDEGGSYSHAGTLQMDFLGWGENGRIYNCPFYAPCTCRCVAITDSKTNNRVFESVNLVHYADSSLDYITFEFAHDDFPLAIIGSIFNQGDLIGHTGTKGADGDHVHFQTAKGTYQGWEQVPPNNNWQLIGEISIYNACYVNDTIIINGESHPWKTYAESIKQESEEHKFKWVLYAEKLRNKRTFV